MKLDGDTRLGPLLDQHPYLIDRLAGFRPEYQKLRNPILRATVAKVATLSAVAEMGGVSLDTLTYELSREMAIHGESPEGFEEAAVEMALEDSARDREEAPPSDMRGRRQETLKGIIRDLHAGAPVAELKTRFSLLASEVGPGEIAALEQALIAEGMPVEEIQGLCDVHVEVFKETLEPSELPPQPPGHPVDTFVRENRELQSIVNELRCESDSLTAGRAPDMDTVRFGLARLVDVDRHYLRKEYQLFPFLEEHGISGPSKVMWSIHDQVRALMKEVRFAADDGDTRVLAEKLPGLLGMIEDMVYKEEKILLPVAVETLSDEEWARVRAGEPEIGYAWIEPTEGWNPGIGTRKPGEAASSGLLPLQTGALTSEQVALVLGAVPFDLTFVDENDEVRFYSEGDRVFPRSPAVIGRKVTNCHPPKSVHVVERILDAFKAGERDTAEFWIELSGRFVHIRYLAVRDDDSAYRGCMEVVQDATHVRSLTGQRRLLDWE